jgi:hypothetical protein
MAIQSVITGAIKVKGVPSSACFTDFADLLKSLGDYLLVEIPNQSFSNVVISVSQPGQADRGKIWYKLSSAGTYVGQFIYAGASGTWVQITPAPNQIFWLYGDSATPPAGYNFDLVQTLFSIPDYTALMNQAIPAGLTAPYKYYPAIWVGI